MLSAFVGSDSTVSIVKVVSLSPRVKKVKKLINVSYLNNGESSVFRISLHLYILQQPLSSTQLSHNDSHREQGPDYREAEELSQCPSWQIVCDKDGVVDWCIVLVEMPRA